MYPVGWILVHSLEKSGIIDCLAGSLLRLELHLAHNLTRMVSFEKASSR